MARTRRLRRLASEPMWVLGLVALVGEIDKNIVRGLIDPLKGHFGVGDFAIGKAETSPTAAPAASTSSPRPDLPQNTGPVTSVAPRSPVGRHHTS